MPKKKKEIPGLIDLSVRGNSPHKKTKVIGTPAIGSPRITNEETENPVDMG